MEMLVCYLQIDREKKQKGDQPILTFTPPHPSLFIRYFANYVKHDFGKAGTISQVDVVLEPGPLPFNVSTLDQYRKLGLVVEVDNGVMMLREQYVAAESGSSLTPEQAKVLVHLDRKVDEFKLHLSCVWTNGRFEEMR
jgi:mRNA turnover protein 4